MENWLTSKEIRDLMNLSSQHLYALVKSGKILTKQITERKYLYLLPEHLQVDRGTAIYERVSTPKQKKDLENQIYLLKSFVISQGKTISEKSVYKDIGSGMNEQRSRSSKFIRSRQKFYC